MIMAVLCFFVCRIGIGKFLNFIFQYWTCGINYFCFASLFICSVLCLFQKTKSMFRLLLPIMLVFYSMLAVFVIFRNFFTIVLAIYCALVLLFYIALIVQMCTDSNTAKWKKILWILL